MAGSGLNTEVSVSSRSLPRRDIMASAVKSMRQRQARGVALQQQHAPSSPPSAGMSPLTIAGLERLERGGERRHQQRVVEMARVEPPRPRRCTTRMKALRSQPWLASRCHSVSGFCTTPMSLPAMASRRYSGRSGGSGGRRAAGMRVSHGGRPPVPRCDRQTASRGCGRTACVRLPDRRDRCRRC